MADPLLIIEDEKFLANELARFFSHQDWDVQVAGSLARARKLINEETVDPMVILADVNLPDGNILDLMEEVHRQRKPVEWVLLTGYGSVPDSVRALQLGALDFLEKPCSIERLSMVINGARRGASAQGRLLRQSAEGARRYVPEAFIGDSQPAQRVREMIRRLTGAPIRSLVLSGETGTGKGLVARILHHSGNRAEGPLIEVNCAALPHHLAESELFGHEAGAFTGAKGRHRGYLEQADRGTLFLDEIGELDLDLQAKLLTAIEDQRIRRVGGEKSIQIDIQVIAASNAQLKRQVRRKEFRSDLFHRLSVFQVALPPLRERIEDLEQLAPVFIEEFNARSGKRIKSIGERNLRQMSRYHWPGNIRELRNVIERAVVLSEGSTLEGRWLQLEQNPEPGHGRAEVDGDRVIIPLDGSMALDEMDSYIIRTALERNHQNVAATAKALGTTRETLRYRIQKYQLRSGVERAPERGRVGVAEMGELN
jgi:two-component system, NtrC family, response regulator AtoC